MANEIRRAADDLASSAWQHRDEPGYLERVSEIRSLVVEQLADDVYSAKPERVWLPSQTNDRTQYIEDDREYPDTYPARSETDRALEMALSPILDMTLTPEQRVDVRLRYDAEETESDIGYRRGISQQKVSTRLQRINDNLLVALATAFAPDQKDEIIGNVRVHKQRKSKHTVRLRDLPIGDYTISEEESRLCQKHNDLLRGAPGEAEFAYLEVRELRIGQVVGIYPDSAEQFLQEHRDREMREWTPDRLNDPAYGERALKRAPHDRDRTSGLTGVHSAVHVIRRALIEAGGKMMDLERRAARRSR